MGYEEQDLPFSGSSSSEQTKPFIDPTPESPEKETATKKEKGSKPKRPKTVSTKAATDPNDPSCWNGRADCGFKD